MPRLHHSNHTDSGGRRGYSQQTNSSQTIKRGIITNFSSATYTASVLILEATSAYLTGVPVATHIDGTSAINNTFCAVLFFDEQNYTDAVVLAIYPNSNQGIPTPPPGRTTFITPYQQINSAVIASGSTSTYAVTGSATGIPAGALAVVYKASFTSPTAGASIHIAPHNGTISSYATIGNLSAANATLNGVGIVPLDTSGQIDIKANTGNCTVTLYTYGYVF